MQQNQIFFLKRVFLSYRNKTNVSLCATTADSPRLILFHFSPGSLEMFGFNWFDEKKKNKRRRRRPAMLKASKVKNLICDILVFYFSFEVTWLVAESVRVFSPRPNVH